MAHPVEEMLRSLKDMIDDSFTIPFGRDKGVVDKDKVLGLLDDILVTLPEELAQARNIVETRNTLLSSAQQEAESMVKRAEERAKKMVSEQEVYITAKQKANDLMAQTKDKTRELRITTNDYVDNLLKRTEEAVNTALNEVRQSRVEFRKHR